MRGRLRQCPSPQRGHLTGPNPTDRGKKGSKIHLLVDRNGLPVAVAITAANTHDSRALQPLVQGIPPVRSRRGPRPPPPRTAPCGQGLRLRLRLRLPATMASEPGHRPTHRPPGRRILPAPRPAPLGGRTHHVLAVRLPTTAPPLRTQGRALPRLRHQPDQLPTPHQVKRRLSSSGSATVPGATGRLRRPLRRRENRRSAAVETFCSGSAGTVQE